MIIDSFLINALIGGLSIATLSGLLGSVILWKKMSYFGDALSHSALLGLTLSILFGIDTTIGTIIVATIFAYLFSYNKSSYSSDTILGIISYSSLAIAIIISSVSKINIDLMGYLFGDILAIDLTDIYILLISLIITIYWFYKNWSKLILMSISKELLQAEGVNPQKLKLQFTLILAIFVAISFKIVGLFLITAMLIIPAATSLPLSQSPFSMALFSIITGYVSVILGIMSALYFDYPTGPSIILISLFLFAITNLLSRR